MSNITAPYNFVPFNKYVYVPEWGGQVSQDIPFEDGEDGYIEVIWKNVSPLCIRDASVSSCENAHYSMHIKGPDGSRLYFLPGSSLRGMLRSTVNIMSFGKISPVQNRYFGHRDISDSKYRNKMGNPKCGWLKKDGDEYKLLPCKEGMEKIAIKDIKDKYPKYDNRSDKVSAWQQNENIAGNSFPQEIRDGISYRIFATGSMAKKKHELLIPTETKGESVIFGEEDDTIVSFFTVYANTPDFENYKAMLDEGKEIPVTYLKDKDEYILGMGLMIRLPYKYGIKELIQQNIVGSADAPDLSETIFGRVGRGLAVKSRVQVGNAFASKPIADTDLPEQVDGVLGEPNPSFYPLYLRQDKDCVTYKTYDEKACISGKKLYRIHQGSSTMRLPQGNGNENIKTAIKPVPIGMEFKMRLVFHNLRKIEIGAILSAITFHRTEGTYHNIGSAKGFGYGKIVCTDLTLHGLKYTEDEYLHAFEEELSIFSKDHYRSLYCDTSQLKTLVAIMSEHDDTKVRMMEMDATKSPIGKNEFQHFKKQVSMLEEPQRSRLPSYLSPKDAERLDKALFMRKRQADYDRIRELIAYSYEPSGDRNTQTLQERLVEIDEIEAKYKEAKNLLDDMKYELQANRLECAEEDKLLAEIEEKMNVLEQEKSDIQQQQKSIAQQEMKEKGLAAFLEKADKWKTCDSRLNTWVKRLPRPDGSKSLDNGEKADLEGKIRSLYQHLHKKSDKKQWHEDFETGKIWIEVSAWLGKQKAMALYKELIK